MKNKLLFTLLTFVTLCTLPGVNYGQVINLGSAKNFVLFTTVGAITNTGITHLTGHVGSNVGSSTNFGNVDGVMNDQNGASAAAGADLLTAYGDLSATIPTLFPGTLLGNGITLTPGVYSSPAPTVLSLTLNLDAQGNSDAVFIFKIGGAFSASANAKVKLLNGAKACNVYWVVEGLVSMASGTTMRGTVIANNAAITMSAGDTLEGRALSINGAISVTNLFAYTPVGCGSPTLTGPANPALGTTECFSLFTGIGALTIAGPTYANGDIGTNSGLTTGFNPLFITGAIHPIPDGVTSQCGTDFTNAYNNMNLLPHDIQLLYPAQFGNNLTLTPHTYWMNGAVTFTDSLYLNAMGNANAVFVIKVNGAFATSVGSKVILINGAQAKNVYWKIDGVVNILDNSVFCGTILAQGAINLFTNVTLNGRALTGVGEFNTYSITVNMSTSCAPFTMTEPMNQTACIGSSASFSVTATGIGLNYQWRKGNVNLVNGGSISGANSNSLTINPVSALDAATNYNVIITGDFLPADTSNNASLIINAAPSITTQPTNQTACAGNNATFTVVASGSGLTYQWRKGLVNIGGETNATLTLTNVTALDVAANYNVVVSGTCLPNATSNNVSLTLTTAPTITTQPTDETACLGGNATFTVIANGSGLTYQWRTGLIDILGETNASLTITNATALDEATNYNVVVSGTCLPTATSNDVSLTLTTAPSITTQPTNETVCAGDDVTFTVVTSGSGISYQWREGTTNILGETNASFTINNVTTADAATNYNVVVIGACAPNDTSVNFSLTLTPAPIVTTQPINQTICEGSDAIFTVIASGSGLTYQWRKGTVNITGETTPSLTINNVTTADVATNYNVIVSGTCTTNDTSDFAALTIQTAPVITTQATNQTICAGDDVTFSVVANGTSLNYQWRNGTTAITGATTSTLTINNATTADASTSYNVIVSGTCAPNDTSDFITLVVNTCSVDLSVVKTSSSLVPSVGTTVQFTIVVTNNSTQYATNVSVDETLQSGFSYVSSTTSTGTFNSTTGIWTIGNLASGASETMTITVAVVTGGIYTNTAIVSATEPDLETANNSSTVVLTPIDFHIPDGFSPNGDGINDLFVIRGISGYPTNEITIFNRWGTKVFDAAPYTNNWDGKSTATLNVGNDVLPVGTYFYILDLGNGSDVIKGTIYLNK
jgi:gliding motility-associated-like protein/uncharacterized repeat protein (TIGR01451 family)